MGGTIIQGRFNMFKIINKINKKFFTTFLVVLLLFSVFNISTTADEEKPDLKITNVSCPDVFFEDEEVKIPVKIKNQGF